MKCIITISFTLILFISYSCGNGKEGSSGSKYLSEADSIHVEQNDSLKVFTPYKNGKKHGVQVVIHIDTSGHWHPWQVGDTVRKTDFVDGKIHGEMVMYKPGNKIAQIAEFKNDKIDGFVYEYYDESLGKEGGLQFKTEYKNGVRDGWEYVYDENGDVVIKMLYENGKRLKIISYKGGDVIDEKDLTVKATAAQDVE